MNRDAMRRQKEKIFKDSQSMPMKARACVAGAAYLSIGSDMATTMV
jgi:hypothetical protein